ncbi:hypothetical protein JTB14_013097 [Gonioctena quinquepunctata]|nr:hypothetical protein JTB14_013097 [Gonioctena quinquepunctata]
MKQYRNLISRNFFPGNILYRCTNCLKYYRHKQSLHRHRKFECGKLPLFKCEITYDWKTPRPQHKILYKKYETETIRKRRIYDTDLNTKEVLKQEKLARNHPVLPGCADSCRKKCSFTFFRPLREEINKEFWKMSEHQRRSFFLNSSQRLKVKRTIGEACRKHNTFKYYLNDGSGQRVGVCKTFFLTTLGYKRSNDRVLHDTLSKAPRGNLLPLPHRNKGKRPKNKIELVDITDHIE